MNRSVTAKFLKALSIVLLLCTYTSVSVSADFVNHQKTKKEYIKAKQKKHYQETQEECLAKNIYYEAGHEPYEGKLAVAQVTLNRVESGKFPSSVCGVVHQKTLVEDKVICQFSWFCEDYASIPINREKWNESKEIAKKVLYENVRYSLLEDALYFHNDQVRPNWNKRRIEKIGRHTFYGDRT